MTSEPNAYAAPKAADPGERLRQNALAAADDSTAPTISVPLARDPDVLYKLTFLPDRLVVDPGRGQPRYAFTHDDFFEHCRLLTRALHVRAPDKVSLLLGRDSHWTFRRWIEPALDRYVAALLKVQTRASVFFGGLLIVMAFFSGRAEPDYGLLAFGVAALAHGAAVKLRPHRVLLLGNAVLWIWLAIGNLIALAKGGSWWNAVFPVLAAFGTMNCVSQYRYVKPLRPTASP